jgi:phospholipase C
MDGFVTEAEKGCSKSSAKCRICTEAEAHGCIDVTSYHDAREIPNYWTYAQNYVLQDNMFEQLASWSLPAHEFMVSGWAAKCKFTDANPLDCVSTLEPPRPTHANNAWTDITYLLNKAHVSWRYYLFEGSEPDCDTEEEATCEPPHPQGPKTPGIWNPLVNFADVKEDGQLGDIQSISNLFKAAKETGTCSLPNVSWVIPNFEVSEHPNGHKIGGSLQAGQTYVTTVINALMRSPCWSSTAIFVSWDDWGGFYDQVAPPHIDELGYGIRVPGMVSPYAKAGFIDHQQLSHDAYLKFIEDDFLGGQRLNPATDGRPDARPDVREEAAGLGNLVEDFNFNQTPRAPLLLPVHPAPGPASKPPAKASTLARAAAGESLPLQLVGSIEDQQSLRAQGGRVYMTLSCNRNCSVRAAGVARLGSRTVPLSAVVVKLAGAHATTVTMSLSAAQLRALAGGGAAAATASGEIAVTASLPGQPTRRWTAHVQLSLR